MSFRQVSAATASPPPTLASCLPRTIAAPGHTQLAECAMRQADKLSPEQIRNLSVSFAKLGACAARVQPVWGSMAGWRHTLTCCRAASSVVRHACPAAPSHTIDDTAFTPPPPTTPHHTARLLQHAAQVGAR